MRAIYEVVHLLRPNFPIRLLCKILGVSKSSYYDYVSGKTYTYSSSKVDVVVEIKSIFKEHKKRYGSRRIQAVLLDKGYKVGLRQIRSIMKREGLKALQSKSFVPKTTQSHPHLRRNSNLLLEEGNLPERPYEVVVGDITYLKSIENNTENWLYLAVWMDLYTRKILAWKVAENMEEILVIDAFKQLLKKGRFNPEMIVHSDGGGQYGSINFRALLARHNCTQSMTRKDNHYDNAFIESLWSRLKTELDAKIFQGLEDARLKLFEYIEAYYNTVRKHSSIGYLSPNQFEELALQTD